MQLAFRPVGVDAAIANNGNRARPFIEPEIITIRCGIGVTPLRRTGERIERFDDFAIGDAVKQDESILGDDGPLSPCPTCLRQMTRGPVDAHFSVSGGPA